MSEPKPIELLRRAEAAGMRPPPMVPDPDLITNMEGDWLALRRDKRMAREQLARSEALIVQAELRNTPAPAPLSPLPNQEGA